MWLRSCQDACESSDVWSSDPKRSWNNSLNWVLIDLAYDPLPLVALRIMGAFGSKKPVEFVVERDGVDWRRLEFSVVDRMLCTDTEETIDWGLLSR